MPSPRAGPQGALASSIAHDSHNLIAPGVDDGDIEAALVRVVEHGGGLAVARDGSVVASVALEVAGLMSDSPAAAAAASVRAMEQAARARGVEVGRPFGVLSFLALLVIPALRLTDRGLVDAARGTLVPVAVGD